MKPPLNRGLINGNGFKFNLEDRRRETSRWKMWCASVTAEAALFHLLTHLLTHANTNRHTHTCRCGCSHLCRVLTVTSICSIRLYKLTEIPTQSSSWHNPPGVTKVSVDGNTAPINSWEYKAIIKCQSSSSYRWTKIYHSFSELKLMKTIVIY